MDCVRGHALLLPFPAQGHITPLMQLAKILNANHIVVTFLNTEFIEKKLNHKPTEYMKFQSFPDGLPPDHVRTLKLPELCESLQKHGPFHVENIVEKIVHNSVDLPPLTMIVADGVFSFTQQIADKFGVPRVAFWTTSACGFSAYYHMPLLIEKSFIPLKDSTDGYENDAITCMPEMGTLRMKDLPSFLRVTDAADYMFQYVLRESQNTDQACLVLLNTFEELEGPVLSDLNAKFGNKVFSIGPLHLLGCGDGIEGMTKSSVWDEETLCLEWLDKQQESSVIYVCFGSITVLSEEEVVEFAWGLEASNRPFLWAIRPDLVRGKNAVLPVEFVERTKERGFFVSWAPQSRVLSHPSVGGFLSHCGWNSTIESISSGVPMICWPFFAEQPTNRRFIRDVWKVGYEMRENVLREEVEDLVRKLMNLEDQEGRNMRARLKDFKESAIASINVGGASYKNVQQFLRQMKMGN